MNKRIVMLLAATMAAVGAWADTETVNGIEWTYDVSDGKATIYKGSSSSAIPTSTSGAIYIPSSLGGYSVASIGESAFYSCTNLTSVTIGNGVTSIAEDAFYNCSGLTSLTMTGDCPTVDSSAFSNVNSSCVAYLPRDNSTYTVSSGRWQGMTVVYYDPDDPVAITFDANGGTGGTTVSLKFGEPLVVPAVTREGYAFVGWSPSVPATVPASNATYTAQWQANQYAVVFEGNGGTFGDGDLTRDDAVQDYGTAIVPPTVARAGYTFLGWDPALPETVSAGHVTYTAQWQANQYTVVFNANGGEGMMPAQTMTYDKPEPLAVAMFSWRHFKLVGWSTTAEGDVEFADGEVVKNLTTLADGVVTLYAVWDEFGWTPSECVDAPEVLMPNDESAPWVADWTTFKVGEMSLRSGAIPAAAEGGRTSTTFTATLTGSGSGSFWWKVSCEEEDEEYDEWYDYAVFKVDGVEVAKIAGGIDWEEVEFAVSGTGSHTLAWTFTRDDWDEAGAAYENAAWVDGFVWTPTPVVVTFAAGGATDGVAPAAVGKYMGYELEIPAAGSLVKSGYLFTGWTDGETTYAPGSVYVFPSSNVTLTAVWELKVWTFGEAVDELELPFTTGGNANWTVDASYGWTNGASAKSGAVAEGQSSWIETTVTNAGTFVFGWNVMGGIYRGNLIAYAAVELDGVQLAQECATSGWKTETVVVEGEGTHTIRWTYKRTSVRTVDGDCAWIDAVSWTPDPVAVESYTVRFDANGGVGGTEDMLEFGTALVAPTVARTGYTFAGWSPSVPAVVPASNVTYTAQWLAKKYKVTFDANGGTGGTTVSLDYGSAIVAPTVTRENYDFAGWWTEPSGGTQVGAGSVVTTNVTYYAHWEEQPPVYAKSMAVAFPGVQAGAALTNFPALVKLSTAIDGFSYADFQIANGGDLRFFDSDGNLIPHEIDTWNTNGVSTVWVKVPLLTKIATITARYGCTSGVPQAVKAKDVWDDDYVGVWHLGESKLPMKESSKTSSDFEIACGTSIVYAAEGVVGGSVDFPTNGLYNALVAPDHDALDGFTQFTIETWTFQNEHKTNAGIISKRKRRDNEAAYFVYDDSSAATFYIGTNRSASASWSYVQTQTMGQWNHIALSVDMLAKTKNVHGYKNGSMNGWVNSVEFLCPMPNCASDLCLGNTVANVKDNSFNGRIDEVRISKCVRSAAWIKATHDTIANAEFALYDVGGAAAANRVLYVNVDAGVTNTLDAALVTAIITNIVKRGAGTLVASTLPDYAGDFTIEEGVFEVGVKNGAGADNCANTIYVLDGASLRFAGTVSNILSKRKIVFEGAPAQGKTGKFISAGGWVTIGSGMTFELRCDMSAVVTGSRMIVNDSVIDLGGNTLTISGTWKQSSFDGCTFRNPGGVVVGYGVSFMGENGSLVFEAPASGSPSVTLRNDATFNVKRAVSAKGWTLFATNSNTTVCGNRAAWPDEIANAVWDGRLVLGSSSKLAVYSGGSGDTKLSNTVFNVKGPVSGSGTLNAGPGWVNLHNADNTFSGAVKVTGQTPSTSTPDYPILPGGGGIGLWNGAACFPNASSITFTNTARLAFMDQSRCSVGTNVVFVALAGETQSVSGGVHTARSTVGRFTKTGEGTLVFSAPAEVGEGVVDAGVLKVPYVEPLGTSLEETTAKLPQFGRLEFGARTLLDLCGNVGFKVGSLVGAPTVTNAGAFVVTGNWTLSDPAAELTLKGGSGAETLGFARGATFSLADEEAFSNAVVQAGADGLVVARASQVLGKSVLMGGTPVAPPKPAAGMKYSWRMAVGDGGTTLRLQFAPPGGYSAWASAEGVSGEPSEKTNGIENAVRYAFGIAPEKDEIGEPILRVVFDAEGNPVVETRELAGGRDDVTFGLKATSDLGDWTQDVPMEMFGDGLWKPSASKTPGYVYPAQMFFRYIIEVDGWE